MSARPVLYPNEEQLSFYLEIGWTITQWAHLEHALYLVTSRVFPRGSAGALASGFYSIENFRSKLAFADRAFKASSFAKKFMTEWALSARMCADYLKNGTKSRTAE